MRRLSSPFRDALNGLATHEGTYVRRDNALYVRDVHNTMVTVHEMVDSQRDLTSNVLEVYLSTVSNRLNDVVKRLTIVATIFLPISFAAGVFGTNFEFMPFGSELAFGLFVASLLLVPVAMLLWFRRQGWL
jgi:magnesium transporter